MKHLLPFALMALLAASLIPAATPQVRPPRPPPAEEDVKLPDGKSQRDEILKVDHEKDLKDAAQLIDLAEQLKVELEKNDRHVLSISSLKKTEEIEKLAKRIHSRLVR
ncbi:MAG TPA: hypothetical protein VKR61_00705 [Bryobacteraceae bacterium]|nr:hypothetical protein [Bryobacteraceae bacterium]